MTVETTDNRIQYPANGVRTNFPFGYKVYDADDMIVKEDGIETTATVVVNLNTDQEANPGGSVDVTPPIAAPIIVSVERILTIDQPFGYPLGGSFPSAIHERALDRFIMMAQQASDFLDRTIRANEAEDIANINLELPGNTQRAGMFLAFDGLGNVVVVEGTLPATVAISPYMQTLMPSLDSNAARALLDSPGLGSKNGFTDNVTFEGPVNYAVAAGTDTYAVAFDPVLTIYNAGFAAKILIPNPNTVTDPVINFDGLGDKPIVNSNGNVLAIGELNGVHELVYDGGSFRVLNASSVGVSGTWTPVVMDTTGNIATAITLVEGDYVIAGGMCILSGQISFQIGAIQSGLQVVIAGLPFPAAKAGGGLALSYGDTLSLTNTGEYVTGVILAGQAQSLLEKWGNAAGVINFTGADLQTGLNTMLIRFHGQYPI